MAWLAYNVLKFSEDGPCKITDQHQKIRRCVALVWDHDNATSSAIILVFLRRVKSKALIGDC